MALRAKIGNDPALQALELAVCARDPVYWCNTWAWTFDPRDSHQRPATLPFVLFPRQVEFFAWLAERERLQEDGLAEKSRDMGLSWLCSAYALHGWLFREGYQVGFGSRKLEYVDQRGNHKSIFEKLRILLRNLPAWMLPAGFDWKRHDCQARLSNPINGSTITGEGGAELGRGDRASIYFVDEAAFLERPQLVDRALSQTTRCRIDVSTPNGPGNPFATKRHSGRVSVFTFHWRDDPRKDDAWYADQKRRHDPVTVAQEIDIDYTASIEGVTIPAAWVRAAVGLELPASGPLIAGLDIADEGRDLNVLITRQGPAVRDIQFWNQLNTTQTALRVRDEGERLALAGVHYDVIGVGVGVKGAWRSMERPPKFITNPVNSGEAPTETHWPDDRTSQEKFKNLRAEMWWRLRARFEKVYEWIEQGIQHPPDEMISIPNHPELIAQLSTPQHFQLDTGKIQLESKADMAKRGVKSPDFGDALALAFLPEPAAPRIGLPPAERSNVAATAPKHVFNRPQGGVGAFPKW